MAGPRVDKRGFAIREEHCNRLWAVNHPNPNFPGNGTLRYTVLHLGFGSFTGPVPTAPKRDNELISEFLLDVLG